MELTLDADVLAARTGDRAAFARLVTRYGGVVTSISLSTVRNVATSEEIAQDVFLAAWRDLGSLRNADSFLPWLRQLTRHRALDAIRRRRRPDGDTALDDAAITAAIDPRPGAEDALLHEERTRAVSLALDALPDDAREVLTLYYREGESVAQVALLLGLREDTVKKRLSRARAALRDEVLAGFRDAVESSAPGDDFARQVMIALPAISPATAMVIGKGVFHLVAKWAALAAVSVTALAGLVAGGVPILGSMRCDMKRAIDERERRDLQRLGFAAMTNLTLFCLGIPALRRVAPAQASALGGFIAIAFVIGHLAIFCFLIPRAKVRSRAAAVAGDPAKAAKLARDDRNGMIWACLASAIILAAVADAWFG